MKDISIAEAYFLCAVQKKGKIFGYDDSKIACLMAAVFHELGQSGFIETDEDKVTLKKGHPVGAPYLESVYEHLKELESLNLKYILQDYNSGWSDRHLNALTVAIGTGLADRGLAIKAKLGLFNSKTYFMPCKDTIPSLAAELLVNTLYQTPVPEEDGFLWLLLEKSACIPNVFTSQQQEDIRTKITSALHSPQGSRLDELSRYTDKLLTLVKHYPV